MLYSPQCGIREYRVAGVNGESLNPAIRADQRVENHCTFDVVEFRANRIGWCGVSYAVGSLVFLRGQCPAIWNMRQPDP